MKLTPDFSTPSSRWQAVKQRDPRADGLFLYGVSTTGIYCRPVCPSRLPNRVNVQFFDNWLAAEQAGYRPCKRCTPHAPQRSDPSREIILRACQLIDTAEKTPTLAQLAAAVDLSPYYFHRLFKRVVGITPKQYAAERRLDKTRARLQQDATVTEAIYNAGFESSSRFYEKAAPSLGMKPSQYKNGGNRLMIRFAIGRSYLGWVLVAASEQGVCRIDFDDSRESLQHRLRESFPQAKLLAGDPDFAETVTQVLSFLDRPDQGLDLPLDIQGTAFQRRVWTALQQIPAGTTTSYGDVAAHIGQPKAARAVAQACGANNIAVAIPCHRVVGRSGQLGGYRWGVERKQAILQREADAAHS
jgi:AraC family transcriptional regulator of adaptative response/methylated-DNA-[protein]-cysteine methyltransferase